MVLRFVCYQISTTLLGKSCYILVNSIAVRRLRCPLLQHLYCSYDNQYTSRVCLPLIFLVAKSCLLGTMESCIIT